ncbi:MAG: hypothetical protein ACYC5H_19245 [Methylovirgula sp.]
MSKEAIGETKMPDPFAVSDAANEALTLGAMVQTVLGATSLPATTATSVSLSIADTIADLSDGSASSVGAIVTALLTQLDAIAIDQTSGDFVATLQSALQASLTEVETVQSGALVSSAASIVPLAGAVMFAAEAVRAIATTTYKSRPDAIAARTAIAQIAATVTAIYAPLGEAVTAAFDSIYGQAADYISQQIASLKPIVLVSLNVSMPANVLAYRLYNDPTRSQELIDRNQVTTPCLMPTTFEAESS